jgi:DNA-entry nuclease
VRGSRFPQGGYYTGYFWNRSHLIADSLGGHAVRRNLVTGTRMQNVGSQRDRDGGMAYCETKVRNWLYKHHTGSVYYRAEPIYRKKELVCHVWWWST